MNDEYNKFIDTLAREEDPFQKDEITFISDYFKVPMQNVIKSLINRHTMLLLAWNADNYLN